MGDAPKVESGQIWADNDKRAKGRKVLIVTVDDVRALVETVSVAKGRAKRGVGKRTFVRLNRFRSTSTGYTLAKEAPPMFENPKPGLAPSALPRVAGPDAETTAQGEV